MGALDVFIRLRMDRDALAEDAEKARGDLEKLGGGAQASLKKVGQGATIVGAAVLGLGALSVRAAGNFDESFVAVRQAVNGTEEDLAALQGGLLDLSKELPFSAQELAGVAAEAGDLGLGARDVLRFTRASADFASATGVQADEAAARLGGLSLAMNLAVSDADFLASGIVGVANGMQVADDKVLSFTERTAATATAVGISTPKLLGLAAAAVKTGVDAESGGNAVNQALTQMSLAVSGTSAESAAALEAFAAAAGMSTEDFKLAFQQDSQAALVAWLAGVHGIQQGGGDAIGALDAVGLGGAKTRNSLLLMSAAAADVPKATRAAEKGLMDLNALQDEASIRNETANAQYQVMQNNLNAVATDIGVILLPMVLSFLNDYVVPAVKWLGEHEDVVLAIGTALLVMVAAVKAAQVATAAYQVVTGVLTVAKWLWTAATWALNAALLANPIVWIIGLIVLLVAAVVLIISMFGDWGAVLQWFRDVFDAIIAGIVAAWDWVVEQVSSNVAMFVAVFQAVWDKIKAGFQAVADFFKRIFDWIAQNIILPMVEKFQMVRDFLVGVWNKVGEVFTNVWEGIKSLFRTVVNAMIDGLNGIIGGVNTLIDGLNSVLEGLAAITGGAVTMRIGKIPTIPHLDTGGFIEASGLAVVHEGEMVVPAARVDRGAVDRFGEGTSVVFQPGSIVVQGAGPEYDAEDLLDRLAEGMRDRRVFGS